MNHLLKDAWINTNKKAGFPSYDEKPALSLFALEKLSSALLPDHLFCLC